MLSSSEQV